MNTYFSDTYLNTINQEIIEDEIYPLIKNKSYYNNEILILYPNQLDVKLLKKRIAHDFSSLSPGFIKTIAQFKQEMFDQFTWSNIYKKRNLNKKNILTDTAKNKFLIDIFEQQDLKHNYYQSQWNYRGFRQDLLKWIDQIRKEMFAFHFLSQKACPNSLEKTLNNYKQFLNLSALEDSPKNQSLFEFMQIYENKKNEYHFLDSVDLEFYFLSEFNQLNEEKALLPYTKKIYLLNNLDLSNMDLLLIKSLISLKKYFFISFYNDKERTTIFRMGQKLTQRLKHFNFKPYKKTNLKYYSDFTELSKNLFLQDASDEISLGLIPRNLFIIKNETYDKEIISIFKTILNIKKDKNLNFNNFAIIIRNINNYYDSIKYFSELMKVPIYCNRQIPLKNEKLVHIVLLLIELRLKNFPNDLFITFINSAYVYMRDDKLNIDHNFREIVDIINKYYQTLKASKKTLLEGFQDKLLKVENEKEKYEISVAISCIQQIQEYINEIPIANNKIEIYQFIELLRKHILDTFSILYNSYKYSELDIARKDSAVLKKILETLDELNFYQNLYPDKKLTLLELYNSLKEMLYSKSWTEYDNIDNHIHIISPEDAIGKSYKHVFIIGLVENEFPAKVQPNLLFKDHERLEISKKYTINMTRDDFQNKEELYFVLSIQTAEENLYLSFSQFNKEGKENLKSFFLDDIALYYQQDDINFFNSVHFNKDYLYHEMDLYQSYLECEDKRNEIEKKLKELFSVNEVEIQDFHLRLWAEQRKQSNEFTEFDGNLLSNQEKNHFQVTSELNQNFHIISPSHLERYGECPHRFFFYDILNLRKIKWGEDTLSRADQGSLVHHCLYELYKIRLEEPDLFNYNDIDWIKNNIELFAKDYINKQIHSGKQTILVMGKEFQNLVDTMTEFVKKDLNEHVDTKPYDLEMDFQSKKEQLTIQGDDNQVLFKVKGQIDRIDFHHKSNSLSVIDYKTGSPLSKKDLINSIKDGKKFQPYLYSLKVKEKFEKNIENWNYFYVLDKVNKNKLKKISLNLESKIDDNFNLTYNDISNYYIQDYRNKIISGQFHVNPRNCVDYCEFKTVCRYDPILSKMKEDHSHFWKDTDEIIKNIKKDNTSEE